MFLLPITSYLMLLMILSHNDVVVVNAFAVERPSNQVFTNEGTEVTWPCTRTQLEYANVEKGFHESTQMKIIPQIKSSIGRNVDVPLFTEKTRRDQHWTTDNDFSEWNGKRGDDVNSHGLSTKANLDREFLDEITTCHECIGKYPMKNTSRKAIPLINNNEVDNSGRARIVTYRSSLKGIFYRRSRREIQRSTWKLMPYNPTPDRLSSIEESISVIPRVGLSRRHSKVFLESLRRHKRLADIPDYSTSNGETYSPSTREVKANDGVNQQSWILRSKDHPRKLASKKLYFNGNEELLKVLQRSIISSPTVEVNEFTAAAAAAVVNSPSSSYSSHSDLDEFTNSNDATSRIASSIRTIDPSLIRRLHKVLDTTTPVFRPNFRSFQPRHFVLAPTKFVDNIQILPVPPEFFNLGQSELAKTTNNEAKVENLRLDESQSLLGLDGSIGHENIYSQNIPPEIPITPPSKIDLSSGLNEKLSPKCNNQQHGCRANSIIVTDHSSLVLSGNIQTSTPKINPNESKIEWQANGTLKARYAANYSFDYRVTDEETANYFGHQESRSEGVTNGQYHVLLPDGRIQKVNYRVDNEGYRANVSYHWQEKPEKYGDSST